VARPPQRPVLPPPAPPPVPEARPVDLDGLAARVRDCRRCKLCLTRTNTVFGVGSPRAPVVFVGEGPGEEEDRRGEPFVGPAGRLLDRMLFSIGFTRDQVYIANVVKCRPPGNRNPDPDEVATCQGYLFDQLTMIRPRVLFALGRFAIISLLGRTDAVGRVRGRVYEWRGIPVVASYHPAFYLRQPGFKKAAWQDLLTLKKLLDQAAPGNQAAPGPTAS
ncbi:MAG: uracil-DNA glycosylase, partial [Magnetococcales bacterium]|nr:uracil-DNA glycosylase [Magnetococcales bacterium]